MLTFLHIYNPSPIIFQIGRVVFHWYGLFIILGIIATYLIYVIANYYDFDWPFALSIGGIFLSIIFSAIVGLIFGLYPAKQAADLDPISALRKE